MSLDWREYWAGRPAATDVADLDELLRQIGKTQFGVPVGAEQLDLLVAHLADSLGVDAASNGVDLGCGNGVVTRRLAERLGRVVGFDYSAALLQTAQTHNAAPNVAYRSADLTEATQLVLPEGRFDVAWSVEVVQNLDPASLTALLRRLREVLSPGFRFLASGIPDIARIRAFYDTDERWAWHLENESAGREQMGRWWSADELAGVAAAAGVEVEIRPLPVAYYTSHYRFDALFTGAPR